MSFTGSASDVSAVNAPLEDLPPELRDQILCQLDLDGLRSLIQTSPVYLQQYLIRRMPILSRCLESTLGSSSVDAYWVHQTSRLEFLDGINREKVETFNELYKSQHSSDSYSLLGQGLTPDDIHRMAAFHCSTVSPILRLFTSQALENLAEEAGQPLEEEPISSTEQARLRRAFYRFQLTCQLLSHGKFNGRRERTGENEWPIRYLWSFVGMFEPWEIEEIACIHAFAKMKFDQIFDQMYGCNSARCKDDFLEGTTCQGLKLLHTFLFRVQNHESLVSTLRESVTKGGNHIEDDILAEPAQFFRRHARFVERDWKEQRREAMSFEGENEKTPPLAWTSIWDGTYSNMYGYVIPKDLRQWGYVMWDAARMENSGAKGVLKRQWDKAWGSSDPRYEEM